MALGTLPCLPAGSIGRSTEVFSGETLWALPTDWHWTKGIAVQSNQDSSRHIKDTEEVGSLPPWRFGTPAIPSWLVVSLIGFWCVFFTRL